MQQIDTGKLVRAIAGLGNATLMFSQQADAMHATGMIRRTFDQLAEILDDACVGLAHLDCEVTLRSATQARDLMRVHTRFEKSVEFGGQEAAICPWPFNGEIGVLLAQVRSRAPDELSSKHVLFLSAAEDHYYNPAAPLFGDQVERAFPSASDEIAEAGKCRALGRWTACVMHLMRALEPGLKALQREVDVAVPKEQWNQIIDQIEAKILKIKKTGHGTNEEQWFSEAASQFFFIKNAWRNYSMHLHERYDPERTVNIYGAVRSLLQHLSTRLSDKAI